MKKINSFSRVNPDGRTTVSRRSTDSQSKGRYSVGLTKLLFTLSLLLTLGVGQMWASDYYYRGDKNSWGATAMTVHNSGLYEYYSTSAQSFNQDKFKIAKTTSGWDYNYSYVAKSFNGGTANIGDYSSDNCYIWESSNGYIIVYYPNTLINTTSNPKITFRTSLYAAPTLYIKHSWDGSSWTWATMSRTGEGIYTYTGNCYTANGANVYTSKSDNNYLSPSGTSGVNNGVPAVWTYNAKSNSLSVAPAYTLTVNNDGHGSASGSVSKGIKMSTKYAISASSPSTGYHFNNWTRVSGGTCTFDNASSASTNVTVTGDASATVRANFALNTYTVAYNANDAQYPGTATGSTSSSSHTYGTAKALTSNGFSRAGYTFAGWATTPTGSVAYSDGQSVTNLSSTHGATVTLYAKWTENMSDVSLVASPTGKGSFTIGGAAATSTTAGVTTTRSVTAVPIAGYSFDSWSISGGASISSTSTNPTTVTGGGAGTAATLTATFVANPVYYDVTFGVGTSYTSLGSISATNNTTSSAISSGDDILSASNITFTATPNTGYTVEGWYTNAACTEGKHDAGSTTYTIASLSSDVTVYVKFVEKTWSVAFAAGTGGTVTTPNSTPRTVGQLTGISIAATPSSGYTFNTWTITSGSGSFTSEVTTNSNKFKPTAASTITASFTETMRTITINGGTAASTTAGISTTGSATAATPAAGKKFTGWTLGDGVSLSGGSLTDRTINFTATGNSSVTANYADRASVKMYFAKPTKLSWTKVYAYAWKSSDGSVKNAAYPGVELENTEVINCVTYYTYQYYTEGDGIGGAATGNSAWNRIIFGDNNDARKTGDLTISNGHYYYKTSTGTGETAALTSGWGIKCSKNSFGAPYLITHDCANNKGTVDINLTGGQNYTFKVYDAINDQWWSNSTSHGSSSPITASMATASTVYDDANNMQVNTALTGDYTFEISATNAANPKIKVTFPEIYAIVGSFNSWNTETNPLSMDGNTGTADIVLAPSGSNYTLKVVDDGSMYGKNSTTITGTTTVSSMSTSGANINLTADIYPASANPSYGFSYNKSTKALTVTYPSAHTVTYGVGTHAGTTSVTSSISVASGKKILDSQSITFSKGDTKTGYTWKGWYNNTSGSSSALGTDATYTSSSRAANTSVYACYNLVTYTITYNLNGGSNPVSPAPATSFTIESSAITLPTPTKTGYSFSGWYENADLSTGGVKTTIPAGSTGNKVYYAKWTPITYTIHFNGNGNTSGSMSNQTGVTYDAATTITANAFVKTGYNFAGWATTQERANAGTVDRTDGAAHGNLASTQGATAQLWAVWTPKSCDVVFDFDESDAGYGSKTGASTGTTATYGVAMTPVTPPTAAEGYAFMGYYTAADGAGIQYYDGDGNSAANWAVDTESETTLYAYYKQAEITSVTFDDDVVEPGATITATANIDPDPAGTTTVCWRLLHDNGNEYTPQPTFTPASGATVRFTVPETSTYYKVEAKLRTGNDCSGGTLLDTKTGRFQVAGSHTVTVYYKNGANVIKASSSVTANPLDWSEEITAPDIFGYTFSSWTAADGVTIKNGALDPVTSSTNATIQIKATYNGSLTANYTPKNIIYFKDNLEWTDPEDASAHIYLNLLTSDYWNDANGTGNEGVTNRNLQMDRVPGTTDIFYYDYGSKPTSLYVSFTKESMDNYTHFYQSSGKAHVVFPSRALDALGTNNATGLGFYAATPMFVPLATQTPVQKNSNHAEYYNDGYWTKYLPGTGYSLDIYQSDGSTHVKTIAFTSADELMPMKVTTDLEGGHTYKFQLKRDGDVYYGNSGTMTYEDHGQNTPWDFFHNPFSMCSIVTNAAGNYTFNLSYSPNSGGTQNRLRMSVDYPVADGDYRLLYSDAVQTKPITSAIVNKENNGTAIVSFFVRPGSTPVLRIQQASIVGSTVTWKEYPTIGTPTNQITGAIATALTSGGTDVYNFNLSMNGSGALSVASVEKYTGNYYIRTDAANSKWDNYRTDPDHRMTYSEYSITHGGYTHYYVHWVNKDDAGRKNVKFCIANDYSPNISDTLAREAASGTWANIDKFIDAGGDLKRSANVRFMWDKRDNSISRAYVDGAQGDWSENFLYMLNVEAGEDKIKTKDATDLTDHKVTFKDNGNWMYEANVKAQPTAKIKLLSNWGTENTITQYFRGASDDTETLLGGSGTTWYDIRIIYDFKTNRLIAGLIPSGNISDPMAIHADVMFVREHHGDIAQLTFTDDGALTDIETAFGVLQLNKWTINNKSKADGHAPLSPLLSQYERDLFYISFPFRVSMEEVFGFGTYGQHWIIEEYDGASRAANGYWQESGPNWKFVFNRKNKFFEPGTGYIIALDLDEMGESADIWANTDQVELYFPSYGTMDNITSSTATYDIPAHECTINRSNEPKSGGGTLGPDYDRRVKDSHWNVLGVPTYVNPEAPDFANTDWTTSATETSVGPNFLYEWNMDNNTVTAVSASDYTYHAMHAYLVQYCGDVTWTSSVSVKPSPIVARTYEEAPKSIEFRLELMQDAQAIDQTFVKLSDNEAVTTGFEFNYDLSKEFNKSKSNIYTLIGTEQVAGNVLPLTEQTTIVPVGVIAKTNGDYTFSMPDGTAGIGVTLIDNETGIRTSLSALDYTVFLEAGTYDGRFVMEISPIVGVWTNVENVQSDDVQSTKARKVIIDQNMYIIKNGKMFDARGAVVK